MKLLRPSLLLLSLLPHSSRGFFQSLNHHHHYHHASSSRPFGIRLAAAAAAAADASSASTTSSSSSSSDDEIAVQLERLPQSAVRISIPVPGSATQAAYEKVCNELSKTIAIPGFRKGSRIPPQVLEQSMVAKGGRNALKVQAIHALTLQLVEPALKEQSLDPIGKPTLAVSAEELAKDYTPGEPLTLIVQCDVWPEIVWKTKDSNGSDSSSSSNSNSDSSNQEKQVAPYIGLTGSYKRKPVNQDKINAALRDLKERFTTLEPIVMVDDDDNNNTTTTTYVLQMGDACNVNMVGYMATDTGNKGDLLPNAASGENVPVVLGSGRYMEGLVEGLIGAKVGETRTVTVNFPEKLRDKSLAGKQAIFDVQVLSASKRIVPDLTDAFANEVRKGLTADGLLNELRTAIDQEDAKTFAPARNKALRDALAQVMEVDVPDTLVTNQAREKFAVMMAEMRDNGVADAEIKRQINPENFAKYKDIVKADIIRDFKVSMGTDEIARLEGIEVPAYQVEEQMEAVKKEAAQSSEEMDETMIRARVETTLQRQAVMDWLAEQSDLKVVYGDEEFDEELMQRLADESLKREEEFAAKNAASAVHVAASPKKEASSPPPAVDQVLQEVKTEPAVEKSVESAPAPVIEKTPEPKAAAIPEPTKATASEPQRTSSAPANAAPKKTLSLAEKAFQALFNSGSVKVNKAPDDPDYDSSHDDELAPENTFKT